MICDAFERAYRENGRPNLEEFLLGFNRVEQAALLAELLSLELELDPERSHPACLADYAARFPSHTEVVRQVFSVSQRIPQGSSDTTLGLAAAGTSDSFLAQCPLFATVPVALLEPALQEQEFAVGEYLLRQGEPGKSLLIVCEGSVEVSTIDPAGKCHVIDHANSGNVLGEMALLTAEPCSASARALSPVRAKVLVAETFHRLARRYPEISVALSHLVADRLGKPSRDALTDKVLDRFQIRRRLGRGGMGVVYEAQHTISGERVALKMMSHRLVNDSEALRCFQQEADIIESFEHPNIVRMHGRFAAFHTFFIILEYCEGRSLAQVLAAEGPMDEARFRQIVGNVASALDYAHRAHVVHRDVKPANVMLSGAASVKLMDFGLAEPGSDTKLSDGRIVGTPRYMAPELRAGKAAGREADFFSFACLAYEMLTAKPLFDLDGRSELGRSFASWIPPSLKDVRPDLDPTIDELLQAALHRDPQQRRLNLASLAEWAR